MGVSRRDFLSKTPMLGFFSVAALASQSPLLADDKIPVDKYDDYRTGKILDKAERAFPNSRSYLDMIEQAQSVNTQQMAGIEPSLPQ